MTELSFQAVFGEAPEVITSAPGRVNLIGEHTDYNGGFVLPLAIPQRTQSELRPRADSKVRALSANLERSGSPDEYLLGEEARGRGWLDYVQGCTAVLRGEGHRLSGFDLRLSSQVPLGSGLSSSAALSVSLLRGLRKLFALPLDDVQLARIAQRAECDFVGAPVGIMDPMACSLAEDRAALFLDTQSLEHQRVPLPPGIDLVVINSGIAHSHAGGEYRLRRAECEKAGQLLGVKLLRELQESDLSRALRLPEPLGRRVRHVVTENARVLATVDALRRGEVERLKPLMAASHASMRDDYQISVPDIDLLVQLADEQDEVLGARMTGGGFGGSVVILARAGTAISLAERVAGAYAAQTGRAPTVLVPTSTAQ